MRKVSLWIAPVVAAAAIMALTLSGVASASKVVAKSPVHGATANAHPFNATTGKLLKNVLKGQGFGTTAPAGFAPVDSASSIACPATKAPCTIEMIAMVQFDSGAGGYTPGPWAICLDVDGSFNSCPYMDVGANNGFYTAATATGYLQVSAGTHSVQTYLYTNNGSSIYNYDIAYHEYG